MRKDGKVTREKLIGIRKRQIIGVYVQNWNLRRDRQRGTG